MGNDETPPKHQRLPTVSFSLPVDLVEELRTIGARRDVSLSQIVREALDLALEQWGHTPVERESENRPRLQLTYHHHARKSSAKPGEPELFRWPRSARRYAARHGEPMEKSDRASGE
jgi:hypothetical protein